jgi:hypothetical protein
MFSSIQIPVAQAAVDLTKFGQAMNPIIANVIYPAVGLLFGVAVLVFVYGVLQLVIHGGDPDARKTGQSTILYGTLGIVIMVSAWGIIYFISNTVKGIAN